MVVPAVAAVDGAPVAVALTGEGEGVAVLSGGELERTAVAEQRRKTEEGSGGSSCFKGEGDAGEASNSCFATPRRQLRVGAHECGTEGRSGGHRRASEQAAL